MSIKKISVTADYCFGTQPLVLENLSKVNFIFAQNGSGKTTISNTLAGQPSDAPARVAWTTAATPLPIRVFNERYREHVLQERVDGIFTMGAAAGTVVDRIAELESERQHRKRERQDWETTIGSKGDEPTGLYAEIEREESVAKDEVYRIYNEYRDKDSIVADIVFKGFNRNRVKILDETLRRNALPLTGDPTSTWDSLKPRAATISGDSAPRRKMPSLSTRSVLEASELQDLNATKPTTSGSSLSSLIHQLANEDWVSEGRKYLNEENTCCPFCQQPVPPNFLQRLEDHFASGFDAQLQRAHDIKRLVSGRLNNLKVEISAVRKFVEGETLADQTPFITNIQRVESECTIIESRLSDKVAHPTTAVSVDDVTSAVDALQFLISSFNEEVKQHNTVVSNAQEERKKIVEDGWRVFLSDRAVKGALSRYQRVTTLKNKNISELEQLIADSEDLDTADEVELLALREQVSNTQEVADRINGTLNAMGFHRFHIQAESGVSGGYRIVRADGSFAHESLSEGERTFLCFVYFWESLFGTSESGAEPEDVVAVIDDPISSLDSETLFLVAAHVRQAAGWAISGQNNLKQLIVLTHNTQFHHEAAYEIDRSSRPHRRYFRLLKQVQGITIAKDDGHVSKIRGSYPLLWDSVVEAARSEDESNLVRVGVFNIVRRIIEGYFKTIGQVSDYQMPGGLAVFEERVILMFHMWASSGSHTIADDMDQTIDVGGTQQFLRLFRRYFDLQGHSAHFDMMLSASNGEELAMQGEVFAPWIERDDTSVLTEAS